MKDTRRSGMEKIHGLWKGLTSGIADKINERKNNILKKQNTARDMGDNHTPISHLDLTGMNREQAKELIGRVIDEKLKMISRIEMTEPEIDYKERERQRARAAERINERRNRRKSKSMEAAETIVTDQGVYSDYKHASVFDVIQPESFPYEENAADPLEGQISILDAAQTAEPFADTSRTAELFPAAADGEKVKPKKSKITFKKKDAVEFAADPDLFKPHDFDLFGIFPYRQDKEIAAETTVKESAAETGAAAETAETGTAAEAIEAETAAGAPVQINRSLDEAVDKVFAVYNKYREKLLVLCRMIRQKTSDTLREKVLPAALAGMRRVKARLTPLLQRMESRLQLKKRAAVILAVLSEKEKKTSEKMARFVETADRINEAFLCGTIALKDKVCLLANRIRDFAETHKKALLIEFGIGVVAVAAITLTIGNATAYEYVYNGKVLGVVKNQEDVYQTIDIIGDKLSVQYDVDITIDKDEDIRFNKIVLAFNQDVDNKEDILNRLTYMRDMKANGKGIYVDGELMAILESEKTAKNILEQIQNEYLKQDPNIQYEKIGFAEAVEVKDVETKLGNIETRDKALEYMMTGAVEQKIHVVQSGETFSEIAKMYGLKQSELQATNPGVIPEKLHIGQEICLNRIVPLVTVQTTEVAQYKEAIPFEIAYENTGGLYKNEQTVKSRGVNGEKDVVAEIVRNNGIEVSRNELSATILSQPVSQVVLVGTKDPPPLIGTGTFIYPIRGTLTSRYETRWGRLHAGIDLAAPIGTHIKASDGGKVTFAGYNGALGYMVEIDHGGGRVTWYGHCSKLFVKKGDKVYQGQHIANVGNTGRSTGPHVHFEVHINGKTKNPLNYL